MQSKIVMSVSKQSASDSMKSFCNIRILMFDYVEIKTNSLRPIFLEAPMFENPLGTNDTSHLSEVA